MTRVRRLWLRARRRRRVLWGARDGDLQLAFRTDLQLVRDGWPLGSELLRASDTHAAWWLWVPYSPRLVFLATERGPVVRVRGRR